MTRIRARAEFAWASLSKVDATTFQPGDRILFRDGDSWTGQLWPKGSGSVERADHHRQLRIR